MIRPEAIRDVRVHLTVVGGRQVFGAGDLNVELPFQLDPQDPSCGLPDVLERNLVSVGRDPYRIERVNRLGSCDGGRSDGGQRRRGRCAAVLSPPLKRKHGLTNARDPAFPSWRASCTRRA